MLKFLCLPSLATSIIILAPSCNPASKELNNYTTPERKINLTEEIIHTWVYASDNIFYSCYIDIKPDSTFSYKSTGCMGSCYSEGTWTYKNSLLSLTSFETYAPKKTDAPEEQISYEEAEKLMDLSSPDSVSNSIYTLKVTKSSVFPTVSVNPSASNLKLDSTTTFFKERLFAFEKDTLYELKDFMQMRSGSKYYKSQN
jgi:hypothetical protein